MVDGSFSGNIQKTPLAQVLRKLYLEKSTGVLDLKHVRDQRMVALYEGEVRSARSNSLEKRIGQYALVNEKITRIDLLRAMSIKDKAIPMGQKLVQVGALDDDSLEELLQGLVREIVTECFSWPEGEFRFRKGRPEVAQKVEIRVSTADIIYQGFRRYADERRARRIIGDLNAPLAPNANLRLHFQHITLNPDEQEVLAQIDGSQSATQLSCTMPGDPTQNIVMLASFLACGLLSVRRQGETVQTLAFTFPGVGEAGPETEPLIDEAPPQVPPKPEPEPEKPADEPGKPRRPPRRKATVPSQGRPPRRAAAPPPVSAGTAPGKTAASPATPGKAASGPAQTGKAGATKGRPRRRKPVFKKPKPKQVKLSDRDVRMMRDTIMKKYALVNAGDYDYYNLLGLPYKTTQKEVYYSFTTLCTMFHPDLALKPAFADLKRELEVVFQGLEAAYDTLMDVGRREAYDRRMRF